MPLRHSVKEVTTKTGIKGLLIDIPGATVAYYTLYFKSGYYLVQDGAPMQTAHVIEHILMRSTTSNQYAKPSDVARAIRKNGAYTNGMTYTQGNWYIADSVADDIKRVLGIQWLVLNNPDFNDSILQAEAGNVQEEMSRNVGNNERLVSELVYMALGTGLVESKDSIEQARQVTVQNIKDLYASSYTLRNARFIIAGDANTYLTEALTILDESTLPEGEQRSLPSLTLKRGGVMAYRQRESLSSIALQMTFALPRRLTIAERHTMRVIANLLFNQTTAKILGAARDQGICYSIQSGMEMVFPENSLWTTTAPISPKNIGRLFELMITTLGGLMERGIDEADFSAVKTYTLGNLKRNGQTPMMLTDFYFDDYFYDDRVADMSEFDQFASVDVALANDLLHEFLHSGIWAVGGVGGIDEAEFKTHYDQFAKFMEGK